MSAPAAVAPQAPSRLLGDQLCFALYAASRAVTALYRPILDTLGLTYPQYLVLLSLWERDGATVKRLGQALQLDYGTLSPLLRRMETAGLVRRERRADDERSVRVFLTDAGRALDARAEGLPSAIAGAMALGPGEIGALRDALTHLAETVARAEAMLEPAR